MTPTGRSDLPSARRLTNLLVASAVGVYLLMITGATTSILDSAAACSTWPGCYGPPGVSFGNPRLLAAWSHRLGTLVVGVLLVAAGLVAWSRKRETPRRIRLALGVAVGLYPIQIGIGAMTVLGGAPISLSAIHLTLAVAIFSATLLALLWHLESATQASDTDAQTETITQEMGTTAGRTSNRAQSDSAAWSSEDVAEPPTYRERAWAYFRMMKPKLWWLLCLVAVGAMALAGGPRLDPVTVGATLLGGVLAIGASGTFNNVLERDVDRQMDRTDDRPLVQGQIPVWRAVGFGVGLTALSVAVFLIFVNVLAAALGIVAVLFYSVGYTLVLKPNTSQNIVIGGAVGAFPALIGWAAVTNTISLPALALGTVIFLWTPAHFYNLALVYKEDYASADIPMLPVVRGEATTRKHIFLYLGATMLAVVLLGGVTQLGWIFATGSAFLGSVFLWAAVQLFRHQTEAATLRTFHAANAYLGGILILIFVEGVVL